MAERQFALACHSCVMAAVSGTNPVLLRVVSHCCGKTRLRIRATRQGGPSFVTSADVRLAPERSGSRRRRRTCKQFSLFGLFAPVCSTKTLYGCCNPQRCVPNNPGVKNVRAGD